MYTWIKKRRYQQKIASNIYKLIVDQARSKDFYLTYGVPDTELGRFEMICLHCYLIFKRFSKEKNEASKLSQKVHDLMFADFDQTLREKGIGDMGIGKRIKSLARNLYGRIDAYEKGYLAGTSGLYDALTRNLYASVTVTDKEVYKMVIYVNNSINHLFDQDIEKLLIGEIDFMSTEKIVE
ncbi:MAG: phage tail protein [Alphaproteobacteria bacterium]|jgi:cytochrome b pre-mRNA-processing protein 3|nr:phage tail protein [Alphaproteobacteria bacterium]PPR13246.1 MAG: hypothetical protein CFH42_01668 [Alphaproteobacteria bacterium MarineAlpha12_Bin1]|tara:strand:- start:6792 stop:7334 length:543 start_codon:yes stop_codon:yes gene_type:complete